jgi:hypothetical protein
MRRLKINLQALIDVMTLPEEVPWRSFLDLRDGAIVEVDLENEKNQRRAPPCPPAYRMIAAKA